MVEFRNECIDALSDVSSNLSHLFKTAVFWVGQVPADVELVWDHRAGVVARGHHDLGPLHTLVMQALRDMIRCIDADLLKSLEYDGVGLIPG